jgi:hypothetical protein
MRRHRRPDGTDDFLHRRRLLRMSTVRGLPALDDIPARPAANDKGAVAAQATGERLDKVAFELEAEIRLQGGAVRRTQGVLTGNVRAFAVARPEPRPRACRRFRYSP